MDKNFLKAAQTLVKSPPGDFSLSQVRLRISEEIKVGVKIGKKIRFSIDDLIKIENYFKNVYGISLLDIDLNAQNRLEASEQSNYEKWAKQDVFATLLNFASLKDPIYCEDKRVYIPEHGVFSCELKRLNLKALKRLMIVENGSVLLNLDLLDNILPPFLKGCLTLYRGHGGNEKEIFNLLKHLNKDINLYLFCDLDGAGLNIAKTLSSKFNGHTSLILPKTLDGLKKFSKDDCYLKQLSYLDKLKDDDCKNIANLALKLKNYELAVTQECMLSHKIELCCIDL